MNKWRSFSTTRKIANVFHSSTRITPASDEDEPAPDSPVKLPEINGGGPLFGRSGSIARPIAKKLKRTSSPPALGLIPVFFPSDSDNDQRNAVGGDSVRTKRLPSLRHELDTRSRHSSTPSPGPNSTDGTLFPIPSKTRRRLSASVQNLPETFELAVKEMSDALRFTISTRGKDALTEVDERGATMLHHASTADNVEVMKFLLDSGADVDAVDYQGGTPLHWAASWGNGKAMAVLLEHGGDPCALDNNQDAPLHLAVRNRSLDVIKALKDTNLDVLDGRRRTAFHIACTTSFLKCITLLAELGCKVNFLDKEENHAVHLAAHHGSREVLEKVLEITSASQPEDILLHQKNRECMTPLHAAVDGSNFATATLLLRKGASICNQEGDQTTPFHLACAQGNSRLVCLMLKHRKCEKENVISLEDHQEQTPLHYAARSNHGTTCELLIAEGADLNAQDREKRSPLMAAVEMGSESAVFVLLRCSPDLTLLDKYSRSVLHIALKHGNQTIISGLLDHAEVISLVNKPDSKGLTPTHYASQTGQTKSLLALMELGADANLKDKEQQTPMHFAAKHGHLLTIMRLLEHQEQRCTLSDKGQAELINREDRSGRTPLHMACLYGKHTVVRYLVQHGAVIHYCNAGWSPLHYSTAAGHVNASKVLMHTHSYLVDSGADDGSTPLHLAAREGHHTMVELLLSYGAALLCNDDGASFLDLAIQHRHTEAVKVCVSHKRWMEILDLSRSNRPHLMLLLIEHMPSVAKAVLDRSVKCSHLSPNHDDYWVEYNFKYLLCQQFKYNPGEKKEFQGEDSELVCKREQTGSGKQTTKPWDAMKAMVEMNRIECLSHNVSLQYIENRWKLYGRWAFLGNILLYSLFVLVLTFYVGSANFPPTFIKESSNGSTTVNTNTPSQENPLLAVISARIGLLLAFIQMLKELMQLKTQGTAYFQDLTNAIDWLLAIFAFLFLAENDASKYASTTGYEVDLGVMAIFLSWFNLMLFLRRVGVVGIYIVMFLEVLRTLIIVLSVFFLLFVAFGVSFYIMLQPHPSFGGIGSSLFRMFFMLLGEFDYTETFKAWHSAGEVKHWGLVVFMLILFGLLMPVILINLMIGLAVGNIEEVQKNAFLKRLEMQVELHAELEESFPKLYRDKICKLRNDRVYPNRKTKIRKWLERMNRIFRQEYETPQNDYASRLEYNPRLQKELDSQKEKLDLLMRSFNQQQLQLQAIMKKLDVSVDDHSSGEIPSHPFSITPVR